MKNKIINIERVLDENNINKAIKSVVKRKGCAGVDGMTSKELPAFWDKHGVIIKDMIIKGTYNPAPAKRGFIGKYGTKEKRALAIPSVLDRMLQNAILFVLSDYYESEFHNSSFGFRKGRNTYMAIEACLKYMNAGYVYIADLDILKFFDNIKGKIVIEILKKDISDKSLLKLIKKYLKMDVNAGAFNIKQKVGVVQGGPLSPLFANIVLNEFDWYLESLGFKFVRYADDIIIMCKTREEAAKILEEAEVFLAKQLELQLNKEKTKLIDAINLEYMGYGFKLNNYNYFEPALTDKIKKKMYEKMIKNANKPTIDRIKWWDRIGGFNRGWINYFSWINSQDMKEFLNKAEKYQYVMLYEKINCMKENEEMQWALLDSKQYILLTEWFDILLERTGKC